MKEELLDAECVIKHLCKQNIILITNWQNQHPADQNYLVYFNHPNNEIGDIVLSIIKRKEKYYISRSLVGILSYRHHFNADNIYTECYTRMT